MSPKTAICGLLVNPIAHYFYRKVKVNLQSHKYSQQKSFKKLKRIYLYYMQTNAYEK